MPVEKTVAVREVRVFGRVMPLPRQRWARVGMGSALVAGGFLGFLPILGFWMVPVGLLVLSADVPLAERVRRRLMGWLHRRFPRFAAKLDA
ncbi:hypothetical protein SAMN05216548_102448 [Faunimonas pinastri]|uniref:Transmembrane protein (PGPGW) n=1 Tax=Faunimonas pinastri TaxID=1855383 RepID=A0A1H9DG10_9HYPH|nr:hypothetical protein [Faunimonas pinastri]SEQ12247.1 hypothetical protein SAMN05216548_102448 [Faunimonas pinastri]